MGACFRTGPAAPLLQGKQGTWVFTETAGAGVTVPEPDSLSLGVLWCLGELLAFTLPVGTSGTSGQWPDSPRRPAPWGVGGKAPALTAVLLFHCGIVVCLFYSFPVRPFSHNH